MFLWRSLADAGNVQLIAGYCAVPSLWRSLENQEMISFAVTHQSWEEGKGQWVMAVDNDRFLVVDSETREFQWLPMAECKLMAVHTPEQPSLVINVQPQQQNGLAVPELNRQMRRNGNSGLYLN